MELYQTQFRCVRMLLAFHDQLVQAAIQLNNMQTPQKIEQKVLDLCAEDDYGSWELAWATSTMGEENHVSILTDVLLKLIGEDKLIAQRKDPLSGHLIPVNVDREILFKELSMSKTPQPEEFHWFITKN